MHFKSPFALALVLLCGAEAFAEENHHPAFSLGDAGVATPQANILSIAAPLANLTKHAARNVKILEVELAAARPQTALPIPVGTIQPGGFALVQAQFDSRRLKVGKTYELVIHGVYRSREGDDDDRDRGHGRRDGDDDHRGGHDDDWRRFNVHTPVIVPPLTDGSATVGSVQVPPHTVSGGTFPPKPPEMDDDVNSGGPPVPTNPASPGGPPPAGTQVQPAPR